MSRHDPALIEAFEANRKAVALAKIPESAIRNFEAMTVAERRWAHLNAEMQAKRHDLIASTNEALGLDPAYNRKCAENRRITAAALKAVGL